MDSITLYDGSGNRIHGRTVNYSAAVITTTLHLLNQSFHLYQKNILVPFCCKYVIHSISYTVPPQVAVRIYRTQNRKQTEQEDDIY